MTKPHLWIFGDSYADPKHKQKWVWTKLIEKNFTTENFALGGSGPDWSLQQLIQQCKLYEDKDLKNINLLFLVSATNRLNLKIYPPELQFFDFPNEKEPFWRDLHRKYFMHKKYFNWMLKNYLLHSTYFETEMTKIIMYVYALSSKFNKTLVWNVFDDEHLDKSLIPKTDNFYLPKKDLYAVDCFDTIHNGKAYPNHLRQENHPILAEQISNYFLENKRIDFKKFVK